jgi:hypothetical protein
MIQVIHNDLFTGYKILQICLFIKNCYITLHNLLFYFYVLFRNALNFQLFIL